MSTITKCDISENKTCYKVFISFIKDMSDYLRRTANINKQQLRNKLRKLGITDVLI